MISYPEIYELLRKEKYSEQLQPLSRTFLKDVAEYFEAKKKIAKKNDDLFDDAIIKTKKQIGEATIILKELFTRRQKKVINIALLAAKTGISKRDSENMLDGEKRIFNAVIHELEEEERNLNNLINGISKEKDLKNKLVRFIRETDEFSDFEGKKFGPFKAEEIANLPKEIAEILIKNNQAVYVEE